MDRPIALITGGTRGIGRAIAELLSPTHHLLIGGRDQSAARAAAELESAEPFIADLSDPDATAREAARVSHLDALIHSAGIAQNGTVADLTRAQWTRVFEINVVAVADLTRMLLPALRAARGQVVTINSGSGFRSGPGGSAYSASKFALRAFTDALREEERGTIRVTSIHPGRVDTDMQREIQHNLGNDEYDGSRYITAASVAATVKLALETTAESMVEELTIRPVRP